MQLATTKKFKKLTVNFFRNWRTMAH